ncbi:antibiotic biosynthesis monooxygenase [Duganella sp. SG902]|uniref:putative quinol monooxygenase n=1 Tax=Duganella sp. SG902 TaxID=2587016 RepID=UPI0028128AF2|nr:antibiotic biosynthesis monooxygenase [Duganella sp. SG902]
MSHAQNEEMMVRISEIQVHRAHLKQYMEILHEEAAASVRLEPGVIAIFPMYQRDDDTEFRILEIYANRQAYEAHLQTPHFQHYKTSTLSMVKSLKLIDMEALDAATMSAIFRKLPRP